MKKKLFLTLAIILCFAVIFTVLTACTNKEFAGKYYKVEGGVLNGESWIELTKNGKWTDDEGASGTYEVKDGAIDFYENGSDEILLSGTISGDDLVVEFWGMESHYRRGNPGDSATETPDGGSPTTYYTVTFNSMGGSEVASVQVAAGTKIAAPATPTKDRYNFSGWYKDAGCTTAWDFSTDVVNGDITLYANWVGEDGKILAVANATISDYNIFMQVQRDVDYVSLADAVTIGGSGTWRLYRDILGSQEIPTKIAAGSNGKLSDGNNIFYIVSTSSDGQQVRTYTLTVHRSYAVSVTVVDPYGNPSYYNSFYTYFDRVNIDKNFPGYTVNGWTCSDPEWGTKGYITDSATFTPSCTPNTYTVTLDAEGGTISSGGDTKSVTYDSGYSLPVPSKTGYSFLGWYCQGSLKTDSYGSSLSDWNYTYDTTFYAQWEINEYYLNARSSDTDAGTVTGGGYYDYRDGVTITATTNPGYTFIGWYDGSTKLSGELTYYFTMPAKSKTYTAKWVKVNIVSENTAKGAVTPLTGTYIPGDRDTITAITNPGYTFIGWYEGGTKLTGELTYSFTMPAVNKTYTAKWIACPVTLLVEDRNAGSVRGVERTVLNAQTTITATTNPGYTFIGWYEGETKLTGELTYSFTMTTENKTYIAKWVKVDIVSEDTAKGTVSRLNGTYKPGDRGTVTATTNPGYTFIGWYEGETKLSGELTYSFTMTTENKTYTAKWVKVDIVSENTAKGAVTPLTGTYMPGDRDTITAITNPGYTFIGWYEGETKLTGELTHSFTMTTENKTYTAKWVKVDIVSEDTAKGTVSQLTGTYMPGDSDIITATTNPGYTFIGWYEGENKLTGELSYTFEMPAEDKTYTAKWIKVDIVSEDEAKGMVSELTETYILGQSVEVDVTTNSGYTFIGLYCGEEKVSGDAENIATFTMPAENKTYTARWEPTQYSVNLIVSGDTVWKTETAGIGSALSMPDAEEGMSFYGWLGDDNEFYSGSDGIINKDIAQDRNLYASFYQSDATPVATGEELQGISLSGKSSLVRNIDLGGAGWTPIGTGSEPFTGTIYGNGYTVSNFKITTRRKYVGLFGYNEGVIQNLGVENFTVNVSYSGNVYAGGLAGYNDDGSITNCYATGNVSSTSTFTSTSSTSYAYAGGLVGYSDIGSITNCYATGEVSATFTSSSSYKHAYAGGLVGYIYYGSITNCYATGEVSASGSGDAYAYTDAGGLVGDNGYGSITNCYATGNVSATGSGYASAGGLAGRNSGSITNCYATGDVSATSTSYSAYAGGLVGIKSGSITNCYRYSGQTFYRKQGFNTYSSASNGEGTEVSLDNLKSPSWVYENLWAVETEIWDFSSGYPTLDYEYIDSANIIISTAEELKKLQGQALVLSYKLDANIDLGGIEWTPIAIFWGTFDGNGYTVSNFKITTGRKYVGLFGYNEGVIQNLGVENFTVNVSYSDYVYAGGLAGENSGSITNCYATGNVSASSSSSYDDAYAGGLVGVNRDGSITNCYATGEVSATSTSDYAYAGGLAGRNSGSITNCYATGNVRATGFYDAYAGGLAGYNDYGSITNCYATGEVSATDSSSAYAGGLVGYNNRGSITNCYATGEVSATSTSDDAYAGGLAGYNDGGSIKNCYATGEVSATSTFNSSSYNAYAGGLAGENSGSITNCYRYSGQTFYRKEGSNIYSSASNNEGTAEDLATLQSVAFHTSTLGWEASVWNFAEGTFPTLKNVGTVTTE